MLGTQAAAAVPEWLQYVAAFAPLSTLAAAMIAGWIAWRTLAQRREADRRDQWWQRTQWAIDLAMDRDFSRAVVGLVTLKHLAASDLCTDEDYEMLDKIGGAKIDALTLSREASADRESERSAGPAPLAVQDSPPGPARAARADVIPVDLESRGERVFAASPEMAKAWRRQTDLSLSWRSRHHAGRGGSRALLPAAGKLEVWLNVLPAMPRALSGAAAVALHLARPVRPAHPSCPSKTPTFPRGKPRHCRLPAMLCSRMPARSSTATGSSGRQPMCRRAATR